MNNDNVEVVTERSIAVARPETRAIAEDRPRTAGEIREQVNLVQEVMREVMHEGEHYGVIPGTPKPSLWKPGAEKLCLTFRLAPRYEVEKVYQGDHLTITSKCVLEHITTKNVFGEGMGSCSTREKKYAYRESKRVCPKCRKDTIFKSKKDGEGWYCWLKKDGCGATFRDGDAAIEGQKIGREPNPDLPDQWNTVLKMANKRSLVAAVLNATAASDIFTQDIEDFEDVNGHAAAKPSVEEPRRKQPAPAQSKPVLETTAETVAPGADEPLVVPDTDPPQETPEQFAERVSRELDLARTAPEEGDVPRRKQPGPAPTKAATQPKTDTLSVYAPIGKVLAKKDRKGREYWAVVVEDGNGTEGRGRWMNTYHADIAGAAKALEGKGENVKVEYTDNNGYLTLIELSAA